MADNKYNISLGVTIDTSDIKTQISNVKTEPIKINFDLNHTKKQVDAIKSQIQTLNNIKVNLGSGAGTSSRNGIKNAVNDANWAYRQMLDIQKKANSLSIKIKGLDTSRNVNELKELSAQLDRLRADYNSFKSIFGGQLSDAQFGNLQAELDETIAKLSAMDAKIADTKAELAKDVRFKLGDDGKFATQVTKIKSDANKLSVVTDGLSVDLKELDAAMEAMNFASETNDIDGLINSYRQFEAVLERVENQLKQNKIANRDAAASVKLEGDIKLFQSNIDSWLTKNSAAAKKFGAQMLELKAQAKSCDQVTLNHLKNEFKRLDKEADKAGLKMQTFGDRIKAQFSKYSQYFSVASMFMYVTMGLRDMFDQVVAIDTAMTELKKVTDETDESYNQFLSNAASRSKEIGTSIDGLVSSTADFARLGYGFEDSQGLAEVANIYAVVGDEIDGVEGATQSLVSTMAAFKDEMNGMSDSDFAMSIVDKFNEVSNNFSISSGGIGDALQRSASSMAAANNTLDETIALITAANTVVQDPDAVGTAFKTISMRIRGAKTELEEAGLETDGMVESTVKLREEIMALTGVDIMDGANQFKSTYAIMDELAAKWKDLTDIQQATVTELIAGKRQGNIVSSLMSNFDVARDALETSLNSSGSAMKEHEKWQQSLEARLNKLKASWQSLAQSFMSSDFLKVALDGVIALVDGINGLIDTVGTLPTLLGLFSGGLSIFKNKGLFTFDKDTKSIKILGDSLDGLKGKYNTIQTQIDRYNSVSLKSASFQEKYNNSLQKSNSSFAQYARGLNGSKASMGGYIASLVGARVATFALQAATIAMNAALTMGISALISWGVSKLSEWIETSDELADRIDDVTSKYKEQHSSLMKLKGDYDTSNEDSMISKFAKLSKGVNSLGENMSLTADEYSEYQSIVNTIADQIPSLVSGYDSQGNAILNCADNVEVLAGAYRNLIREQNAAVLENGEDYFKDFDNDFDADAENALNRTKEIAELSKMSGDELREYLSDSGKAYQLSSYLEANGVKRDVLGSGKAGYESYSEHVIRAIQDEQTQIKSILDKASADIEAYAENLGTVTDAYFSQQFLGEYSHMSDKMQNIITQAVSGFDTEFYADFLDKKDPYEALTKYYNEMLSAFDALSDSDKTNFEAAFDLKTQFNGADISYGEYVGKLQEANSLIERLDVGDEVKSQIRLSLGLSEKDGKWVVEEYQTLLNRLTSKEYEFQLDTDAAESFIKGLSSEEELNVTLNFIEDGNEDFKNALQNYKDVLNEAKEAGVDFSKTTFGNIDTNARQVLEWNSENLEKYKEQLMSFEADDASWDKVKKGYEGAVSTVMGMWDTFEIDGKEVDIAFSPMLQTDNGAEVLSSGTVDTYINDLISKATEDGKWDEAELIALDAEGIEVDGQKIKGILADVGETAEATSKQMHFVGEDGALASAEDFLNSIIEKQAALNEALNFNADIEIDTTALEALNTALTESASAMGLTSDSIDSLESKYRDLDIYDAAALFERTGNGIKVNREELAKLEKEQNNLKKSDVQKHIDSLTEAYNDNVVAIDECANATERARLISENEGYKSKIEELAQYQAQLEGVTGAYQRWINAQETPEDYEGYQAVAAGYEDVEDELSRGIMGNASKEYIDLLSGQDLQGADIDTYYEAWQKLDDKVTSTGYSIKDFFTVDDDGNITDTGIDRFFEGIKEDIDGIYNADTGAYDFSKENIQKIQEEYGMGVEAIELLLEAAEAAGYNVDWGGILEDIDLDTAEFETLVSYAESAQSELNKLKGYEDLSFNFTTTNVADATTEFEKARKAYVDLITNDDETVNLEAEGAEEMRVILSTLLVQKQQLSTPAIMKVDTSQIDQAETDIIDVINKAQTLQKAYENYEIAISTGVDVEGAKEDLNSAIDGMKGTSVDVRADLKLPTDEELQTAKDSIGDIKVGATLDGTAIGDISTKIQTECTPKVIAKVIGLDETAIQNGSQQVVYTAEHSDVDNFINGLSDISKKIIYTYTTEGTKPNPKNINKTITYTYKTEGDVPEAYGTAHVSGTSGGRAFARGDWGIKGNGVALGGELGQELVVRDGRFFTIGDKGAEFFQYKKNDIVFNAAQTESLFKYGGIKGAKPRGKMLASGSAFADGSTMSGGRAFAWSAKSIVSNFANSIKANAEAKKKKQAALKAEEEVEKAAKAAEAKWKATVEESKFSETGGKSGSGGGGGGSGGGDPKDEFEETIDWIEIAIDRAEKIIDRLDKKIDSVYLSWSDRNDALKDQITSVRQEQALLETAYGEYMQEADAVGLDEYWAKKVRDGDIDIESITDEDLKTKIENYKKWYEAGQECWEKIQDLEEKEYELYAKRFEQTQEKYEAMLQKYEHTENMLDEYINQAEAKGHLVSKQYYEALVANKEAEIDTLEDEQAQLIADRQTYFDDMRKKGMSEEDIKNSAKWLEMSADIDSVTQAIEEGNTALIELNNSIRDTDWEAFDLAQERISKVSDEANFLIDLMSNDKMHNDDGSLTDQGLATMALHGQNYNTHMYQADEYGKEINEINKALAEDPYNQDLINRRDELIELQRESILAANEEKEAIIDMVEEGIEIELDVLQERIDKYKESIESQKDLYEYQKKVKKQTEEIASLEKQMSAYANDDSEEAKAKIQELKVSLEDAEEELKETEYDKWISDTEMLLDNLYSEYELVLNERLDNTDYLLEQIITGVNGNAEIIKATLENEAREVGSTLSEAMNNIWSIGDGSAKSVLTMYGEGFQNKQTTTNSVLGDIKKSVSNMITYLDNKAGQKVGANKTSSSVDKNPTASPPIPSKTDGSGGAKANGKPEFGDKVTFNDGKYYYDSQGTNPAGSKYQGKEVYITNINEESWATHPYHISTGNRLGSGDLGWVKLNQISGYATGKKNLPDNEVAWTQEEGQEFIVRPSDGAILTPVVRGDSVLNAAASNNIWKMANSPAEFIKDNLNLGATNVPNNANTQNNYTQHLDKVVFSLPNVRNYDELLAEMQKDKNFERLISSMTIDRIAGKSGLAKGKSIR